MYLQDKRQTYFAEKTANLAKSIYGYNVHEDAMIVVFDSMKVPVNVDEKVS